MSKPGWEGPGGRGWDGPHSSAWAAAGGTEALRHLSTSVKRRIQPRGALEDSAPGRGRGCAKGLGPEEPGELEAQQEPVWPGRGEGREEEGGRQALQDIWGHREDLGFDLKGSGSLGGLWTEEGPESGAHRRDLPPAQGGQRHLLARMAGVGPWTGHGQLEPCTLRTRDFVVKVILFLSKRHTRRGQGYTSRNLALNWG